MRATFLLSVVFALPSLAGDGKKDNNPLPKEKWNLSPLQKEFGLEVKSIAFKDLEKNKTFWTEFTILLEFTKDLSAPMRDALKNALGVDEATPTHQLLLFDVENVAVAKLAPAGMVLGELTGVKGDRFRLVATWGASVVHATKRIEMRPVEKKEGGGRLKIWSSFNQSCRRCSWVTARRPHRIMTRRNRLDTR